MTREEIENKLKELGWCIDFEDEDSKIFRDIAGVKARVILIYDTYISYDVYLQGKTIISMSIDLEAIEFGENEQGKWILFKEETDSGVIEL